MATAVSEKWKECRQAKKEKKRGEMSAAHPSGRDAINYAERRRRAAPEMKRDGNKLSSLLLRVFRRRYNIEFARYPIDTLDVCL